MKITVEINDKIFRDNIVKFHDFLNCIVKEMGDVVNIDTSRLYGRYDVNTDTRALYAFCSIEADDKKEGEST